jgi:hypothetical protein
MLLCGPPSTLSLGPLLASIDTNHTALPPLQGCPGWDLDTAVSVVYEENSQRF